MNEETVDAIKEALTPIAEKIGEGAKFGWEVVVRQQYVEAFGLIASAVSFLVVFGLGIFFIRKGINYERKNNYDDEGLAFTMGGVGMTVLGAVFAGVNLYQGVARLINPEYYAIQFFIGLIN